MGAVQEEGNKNSRWNDPNSKALDFVPRDETCVTYCITAFSYFFPFFIIISFLFGLYYYLLPFSVYYLPFMLKKGIFTKLTYNLKSNTKLTSFF